MLAEVENVGQSIAKAQTAIANLATVAAGNPKLGVVARQLNELYHGLVACGFQVVNVKDALYEANRKPGEKWPGE